MASTGDLINKANTGGLAYSASGNTSTSYWTYAFGNSIYYRVRTRSASSIWNPHPAVSYEFWRYSISQQQWVQVHSGSLGRDSDTIYRVRCNQLPISGTIRAQYDGGDSYLFAFKGQTTNGERSRCDDYIYVYNIGEDTTYDETVKGKLIYARNENIGFKFHADSSGPSSYSVTQNWLKTDGMRGQLITPAHISRMISVKSATSKT